MVGGKNKFYLQNNRVSLITRLLMLFSWWLLHAHKCMVRTAQNKSYCFHKPGRKTGDLALKAFGLTVFSKRSFQHVCGTWTITSPIHFSSTGHSSAFCPSLPETWHWLSPNAYLCHFLPSSVLFHVPIRVSFWIPADHMSWPSLIIDPYTVVLKFFC